MFVSRLFRVLPIISSIHEVSYHGLGGATLWLSFLHPTSKRRASTPLISQTSERFLSCVGSPNPFGKSERITFACPNVWDVWLHCYTNLSPRSCLFLSFCDFRLLWIISFSIDGQIELCFIFLSNVLRIMSTSGMISHNTVFSESCV